MRLVEVRWVPVAALVLSIAGCESQFVVCSPIPSVLTPGETNLIDFTCDELDEFGSFKKDIDNSDVEYVELSGLPESWSSEAEVTAPGRSVEIPVPSWVPEGTKIKVQHVVGVLLGGASLSSPQATIELLVGPPLSTRHLVQLLDAPASTVTIGASVVDCAADQPCNFTVAPGDSFNVETPSATNCSWSCTPAPLAGTPVSGCDVSIDVPGPMTCTFTGTLLQKQLVVPQSEGGVVTVKLDDAPQPQCSSGSCSFPVHTSLTVEATEDEGWDFTGWGPGACADQPNPASITLDADAECVAQFERVVDMPKLQVELQNNSGDYATVVAEGAQISCPGDCDAEVAPNSPVTLRVVRKAEINDQLEITWGGACEGSAETAQVTVDSDKMCTVTVTPRDACAGAVAPSMLALEVWHNTSPLVVDRSSGIAVVQVPRTARLQLDASGTQVSSGLNPTYTWNIGGQNIGQSPTISWSSGDAPTNTSITGYLRFDDGCTGEQTLDMRFDIGF